MEIPPTQPLIFTPPGDRLALATEVTDEVVDWPKCAPDHVINFMKKLDKVKYGENKKAFYSSYGKWSTMNDLQKNNTLAWFRNLTSETKASIIASAKLMTESSNGELKKRTEAVHKNDLVRLIELKVSPLAQLAWQKTETPYPNRLVLDSRNSTSKGLDGVPMWESADGWNELAVIFNDYKNFTPQHRFLLHRMVNGISTPVAPYLPISSEYTSLVDRCYDLNPTDLDRTDIIRTSAWLKEQWSKLRTYISYVLSDFNRSGQNLNKDEADLQWMCAEEQKRWVYHCNNGNNRQFPSVYVYAYGVFTEHDLNCLGRMLPDDVGIDNSIIDTDAAATPATQQKKRPYSTSGMVIDMSNDKSDEHQPKKNKKTNKDDGGGMASLTSFMRESNANENEWRVIEIALDKGDEENKAAANETIAIMLKNLKKKHVPL